MESGESVARRENYWRTSHACPLAARRHQRPDSAHTPLRALGSLGLLLSLSLHRGAFH